MKKQEILNGVPQDRLATVVSDFESEGAKVTTRETSPGIFMVTATWDDVPAHLTTPNTLRVSIESASNERFDSLRELLIPAPPGKSVSGVTNGGLTVTQRQTAQAIVNIFETGEVRGDYGQVTLIPGDTGHLTYGRSQTTLGSGNLTGLLQSYCANAGARFAARLQPYLKRVAAKDMSLDGETKLHNLLRASADDPVMRDTQDGFFDQTYWQPALHAADRMGVTTPLGITVIYDSHVHGSWIPLRDLTNTQTDSVANIGEHKWITAYVAARHNWLASQQRPDLRATVYRMEALERLITQGFWGLDLPLVVRGKEISAATLSAQPSGCFDGPQPGTRVLTLQSPLQRGLDVRLVQLGLSDFGSDIKADGVFGQTSVTRVREFQVANGMPATGVIDIELIGKLIS